MRDSLRQMRGRQGRQGPPGPRGPAGATGARGVRGLTGKTGATGKQGLRGATGKTGEIPSTSERGALLTEVNGHIDRIYNELEVQLKRIAQIQVELDELKKKVTSLI